MTERERIRREEQSKEALLGGLDAAPLVEGIASDTIEGVAAIAAHLGKPVRRVYYLLETGQIPAFKLGRKWHLRKSSYASHVTQLEAAALGGAK